MSTEQLNEHLRDNATTSSHDSFRSADTRSKETNSDTANEAPLPITEGDYDGGHILRRTTTAISVQTEGQDAALNQVFSNNLSDVPLPPMGAGKPYPPLIKDTEAYKVEFDGDDDPLCPLNWTIGHKWRAGILMVCPTMVVTFGSSIYAAGTTEIMAQFHVGEPVAALGVSLYVVGFAVGPVLWGPMSELYGRKIPLLCSCLLFTAFTFWSATADHYYQLMLYRFFSGTLGSAPLAVVAAAFADMLSTESRGKAMNVFVGCVMGGPMLAPIVGGYITFSYLHWRWTMYIVGIMSSLSLILVALFYEETFHPLILSNKARDIRERTGNKFVFAPHDYVSPDFKTIATKVLVLPIKMLFVEPVLFLMSLYHGFIYGILYLCLEAIPIIYTGFGFKRGNVFLPYLAIFIGVVIGAVSNILYFEPRFAKELKASGKPVVPELRLPFMIAAGVVFPAGIFWLCWAGAYPEHVHWIVPVIGSAFVGYGLIGIFIPVFNYIIDTYLFLAASAMAANTFLRSFMGAAFPIFSRAMFLNLGIQWAGTLIGCLGLVLLPVPLLFYVFGPKIRKISKFAPDIDELFSRKPAN